MKTKTRLLIFGGLVLLAFIGWVRGFDFNPIVPEAQRNQAITAEIVILENQELDNKSERKRIQLEIDLKRKEQKVFENANIELRKQKQELLDEKSKLFQ